MAVALIAAALLLASVDPRADICAAYDGAAVVAADGTFLGRIAPATAPDSVFNRHGLHGRTSAIASIWNPIGRNGSRYGQGSVFNSRAPRPPRLVESGRAVGVLTIDRDRPGAISPVLLGAVCYSYFPD